jgi:hypothetical protein
MSAQPLSYTSAGYREPSAAEGVNVGEIHTGLILRQGLPATQGGARTYRHRHRHRHRKGRKTRKTHRRSRGGFHPSVMGGVVQNAPLLVPIALRQAMNLFAKYRKGPSRTRSVRTEGPSRRLRTVRSDAPSRKTRRLRK